MRLCMNEVTILQAGDLFSHIADCAANGYAGLEIRKPSLLRALREGRSVSDVAAALRTHGLEAANLASVESISFNGKRAQRLLRENAEFLFACARSLGCDCVEVIGSFRAPTQDTEEINAETAAALAMLANLAKPYGVRLALEYMGLPDSSVRTFRQCLDIVRRAGRDNAGILLDTWHHYAGGSAPEDILEARGGEIFLVHVSDCPAGAPYSFARSESYLPGQGAVPIAQMLRNVRAVGYDGAVSAELFDPALLTMETGACLRAVRDAMLPLL